MRADELKVTGLHNVANALAALALCRALDLPLDPLVGALRAFKGLPHRVEKVAEVNGITYYDDSKGTNVGATEAALTGIGQTGRRHSRRRRQGPGFFAVETGCGTTCACGRADRARCDR